MNINKRNVFPFAGFIFITVCSTWATLDSAQRLLDWPKFIIWIVSVIFFCGASYGITLISAAFDYNTIRHGRWKYLFWGIILFFGVWGCVILPTNTHTLFYKQEIVSVTIADFNNTKNELRALPLRGAKYFDEQKQKIKTEVVADIANLHQEIKDPYNPGFSLKADSIDNIISKKLGGLKAQRPARPQYLTNAALISWSNQFSDNWGEQLNIFLNDIDIQKENFKASLDTNKIKSLVGKLNKLEPKIYELKEPNAEMKAALTNGHLEIKRLRIENERVRKNLHIENIHDKTAPSWLSVTDLENVIVVWEAFFNDDFKGHGFGFCILIAIIIDLMGFLCYYMAFEKYDFS